MIGEPRWSSFLSIRDEMRLMVQYRWLHSYRGADAARNIAEYYRPERLS